MRCRFNPQSACQDVSEACRRCVSCRYMQFFRRNIAAIGKNHAARHLQEMEMPWQKNVIGILLFPIAEVLKAESHLKRPHKWIKQLTLIENAMNYMAKIGKILLVLSLIFACGCGTVDQEYRRLFSVRQSQDRVCSRKNQSRKQKTLADSGPAAPHKTIIQRSRRKCRQIPGIAENEREYRCHFMLLSFCSRDRNQSKVQRWRRGSRNSRAADSLRDP